jgi:DNA helicase II / ATP-dependent DNA helicase PcrA
MASNDSKEGTASVGDGACEVETAAMRVRAAPGGRHHQPTTLERIHRLAPAAQGYFALETRSGRRELALGPSTALGGELPVLDWRTSPMAEVLFRHAPGEPYEVAVGDRLQEGKVLERWIVTRDALISDDRKRTARGETPLARPQPVPAPPPDREALVVLDDEQQRAVDQPTETSLVLDGEAGVGKTLVALHRVAELAKGAGHRKRRFRALVLVPTEGLRRLVVRLIERLGLTGEDNQATTRLGSDGEPECRIDVEVFDAWMLARARKAFPGLPRRTSEGASAQIIAFKRHPAVREVLSHFDRWKPPRGVEQDDKLPRSRARLLYLWGDADRLERIRARAIGDLPVRAIAEVMRHTRLQFELTTEASHRHVDADRLVALDGLALDAGTERHDAHSFDLEDVPVLFELMRRGALPAVELPRYDHIVVDEAQLRAPLELAMVGDALGPRASVTLAGDRRQASDESAWFSGWPASQKELRREKWHEVTLAITYRSSPPISHFARDIVRRGEDRPIKQKRPPHSRPIPRPSMSFSPVPIPVPLHNSSDRLYRGRLPTAQELMRAEAHDHVHAAIEDEPSGPFRLPEPPVDPAVWGTRCGHALAQAAQICWHLDALLARDPWRQICVIGRTPEHARRLHSELRGLDATLVLDGDFRFEPGVLVTCAAAVSGLEFDAVVLPDMTPSFYPLQRELARAFYVAATRARDWLWLLTPDEWSPLVCASP